MNGKFQVMIGLLATVLWCASGAVLADEFTTLEERMTGDEFARAGLEKLSSDELRFLNEWLKNEGQAPIPAAAVDEAEASERQMGLRFRGQPDDRVVIESRIKGEFSGWRGRTRFELENGQVWQQLGGGSYYASLDSPEVRIEPKSLGSWKLYVDGIGRSVKVKRVK